MAGLIVVAFLHGFYGEKAQEVLLQMAARLAAPPLPAGRSFAARGASQLIED